MASYFFRCVLLFVLLVSSGTALSLQAKDKLHEAYGLGFHHSSVDHDVIDKAFPLMKEAGITWTRGDFYRHVCNPVQGKWDYSIPDESMRYYNMVKILPILTEVENKENVFQHLDEWKEYVRRTVSRYAGKVEYWEVWNEENLAHFWENPDPQQYLTLLRSSCEIIRRHDPKAKIVMGGLNGIPLPYLETCLKLGVVDLVDIINIHPYEWNAAPEAFLVQFRNLKALLEKYRCSKSIWITETGWSTATRPQFFQNISSAALRHLDIEPKSTELAVVCDVEEQFAGGANFPLPDFKAVRQVRLSEISSLNVQRNPVLLATSDEAFPAKALPALKHYLKRGGTVILPQGLPFYFDAQVGSDGLAVRAQVADQYVKEFHLGWETSWSKNGVPGCESYQKPALAFAGKINPPFLTAARFLNTDHLRGKDEFIPIVEAGNGNYKSSVAGIYRLDSDLKGNLIVSTVLAASETVSPEQQAEYLPRTYLIAFASGISKVFWFNMRAHEWAPDAIEAHFGVMHQNLTPKPAWLALKTLIRMCPDGSTVPTLGSSRGVWRSTWTRPDGKHVTALWSPIGEQQFRLTHPVERIVSHLGNELAPNVSSVKLSGGIVYLVGNADAPQMD